MRGSVCATPRRVPCVSGKGLAHKRQCPYHLPSWPLLVSCVSPISKQNLASWQLRTWVICLSSHRATKSDQSPTTLIIFQFLKFFFQFSRTLIILTLLYILNIFFTVPSLEWKCCHWASAITERGFFLAMLGENSVVSQASCPSH